MQRSKFLLLLPAAHPFENERSLKAFCLLLQICDGGYMRRNKLILIAAFQCNKVFHSKAKRLPAKATLKCGHISHARIERVWIESGFHMLFYRINQGLSRNIKGQRIAYGNIESPAGIGNPQFIHAKFKFNSLVEHHGR